MLIAIKNNLEATSLFDLTNQIRQYFLWRRIQSKKKRKRERNSSNRRVRIAKDSHRPSSIQIWSSWRSCSWLWSNPGSLGTRLCSRSNHRIYVAWSVKGSTAAWGAYSTAPTHLCPTKYRVSLLLFAPRSDAHLISKVKHAVGSAAR